jgi:hypothetical protein
MDLSYLSLGLAGSLSTAGILAFLFMLITARRAAYNLRESDELIVLLSLSLSAFTSLACVFYPLANLFQLARQQADLWQAVKDIEPALRNELSSGVLALRITSVAVGINATRSLFEVLRLDPLPSEPAAAKRLFHFREASLLGTEALTVYRNRFAQTAINLVQSGFYELNLALLWSIKFVSGSSLASALLAWAIFYVIDDWRIIFRFSMALKGRFMREHLLQVSRTNWLISIAGVYCALEWSWLVMIGYVICGFALHRLLLYVGYGIHGKWKIPGALDWRFYDQKIDHTTGERKISQPTQPLV